MGCTASKRGRPHMPPTDLQSDAGRPPRPVVQHQLLVRKPKQQHSVQDARRGHQLGVTIGFLRKLMEREDVDHQMTTWDFVQKIVKPETADSGCRYADLTSVRAQGVVGDADAFASHCWQNRFVDLVAALVYVLPDDKRVWIDCFAINQHPGTTQHRDDIKLFASNVRQCPVLVLCAAHLESVAMMAPDDARQGKLTLVPAEERRRCAFWRVWCLVELAAALAASKPVVMLVGKADGGGEFVPRTEMLFNMYRLVDIGDAEATFASDVALILDKMLPEILEVKDRIAAARQVNSLAKGALSGAFRCMAQPAVMRAAAGNTAPLLGMTPAQRTELLPLAAAGGFVEPVRLLLESGVADVDALDATGQTAMMNAAQGGHTLVADELLRHGASVHVKKADGFDALLLATNGGHDAMVAMLLEAGADASATDAQGRTALQLSMAQANSRERTRANSQVVKQLEVAESRTRKHKLKRLFATIQSSAKRATRVSLSPLTMGGG